VPVTLCWAARTCTVSARYNALTVHYSVNPHHILSIMRIVLLQAQQTVQPRAQFNPTASTTVAQPPAATAPGGAGYGAPPPMGGAGTAGTYG